MMAVVSSDEKHDFTQLRNEFETFGQTLNVKINIQSAGYFRCYVQYLGGAYGY